MCESCDDTGYLRCEVCDGLGLVPCPHCGQDIKCDECDGDGHYPCDCTLEIEDDGQPDEAQEWDDVYGGDSYFEQWEM